MRNLKLRHALKTGRRERQSVSSVWTYGDHRGTDAMWNFVPVRGPEIVTAPFESDELLQKQN